MNIGGRIYSFIICFNFVMVNCIIGPGIIAVANEKYFYHCFVSPCFAPECPCLQGISGIMVNALNLQIVANQSKIEHVVTTC